MAIRKLLVLLSFVALGLFAVGGVAYAGSYPPAPQGPTDPDDGPGGGGPSTSDGTVSETPETGDPFTFGGSGFAPGSLVNVSVALVGDSGNLNAGAVVFDGSFRANASGAFAALLELCQPGTYDLVAEGRAPDGSIHTVTERVTVGEGEGCAEVSGQPDEAGLADSGGNSELLYVGGGLLAAGALLIGLSVTRRKKAAEVSSVQVS